MRKKVEAIIIILILAFFGFRLITSIPFKSPVEEQITATIYRDGVPEGETIITISGERTTYLFTKAEYYSGLFSVPLIEKTTRADAIADIRWDWSSAGDAGYQTIWYAYLGELEEADEVCQFILISKNMTRFAFILTDGTIIATSPEAYAIFTEHIEYDPENRRAAITGGIPEL